MTRVFDWSVRSRVEYKEGTFVPEPLDNIENKKELFVFVTGNSAAEAAIELFGKIGKAPDTYFLCRRQVLMEGDL